MGFKQTVLDLDDADIARGAPFHTEWVYGPIPPVEINQPKGHEAE